MQPPLEACRTTVAALEVLDGLRGHVNKHLASDVAVGAYALAAGFRGASINVLVNLAGVKDTEVRRSVSDEGAQLAERASQLEATISQTVVTALQASS
jgi:formiminotetrahydrofolate cyclodeaminase